MSIAKSLQLILDVWYNKTIFTEGTLFKALGGSRWVQLALGVACMVTIANLQYGWTLFVTPLDQKYHWGRPAIQAAFSIFVLADTWLVPLEGYLIDRIGPKIMVAAGGGPSGGAGVTHF